MELVKKFRKMIHKTALSKAQANLLLIDIIVSVTSSLLQHKCLLTMRRQMAEALEVWMI